jgi:hypothetical protein
MPSARSPRSADPMSTSLAELVDDLEQHLHGGRVALGVAEAAAGLHATGPVLRRLAIDCLEPGASRGHESAGNALASACERAGQTWPTDPASRTGQLIGIIGDVLGLHRFELGCQARWWATLRLAAAARKAGDVIAAHEPYAHPYLKQVHATAAAVQRLGATAPPDPTGLPGLDTRLPHPAGHQTAPAETGAAEELTRIAAQLRPTPDGRQPRLTVRQIQSVLHASATAADHAQRQLPEHARGPWHQTASAWTAARLALAPPRRSATCTWTPGSPTQHSSPAGSNCNRPCTRYAPPQRSPPDWRQRSASKWQRVRRGTQRHRGNRSPSVGEHTRPPWRETSPNRQTEPSNTTSGFNPDPPADVLDLRVDDWRS